MIRSYLASLIAVTIIIAPGCKPAGGPAPKAAPAPIVGARQVESPSVELRVLDYDGIQELLAGHKGKVVVMDAWSTACPPCMKEFHHLVELHNAHPTEKLACVSLSFDYEGIGKPEEQSPRVLDFLREQKATFDNILSSEESQELYRKFMLTAVPAVFVYNQQGELVKRFDNEEAKTEAEAFTYADVKQLVEQLLKDAS
jgi:thiol-disulfide isomerase/thioredoxin